MERPNLSGHWTQAELECAVHDVVVNRMPIRKAGRQWNIPFETLRRYVAEWRETADAPVARKREREDASPPTQLFMELPPPKKRIVGHPTTLTEQEEKWLVNEVLELGSGTLPADAKTLVEMGNAVLRQRRGGQLRDAPTVGLAWAYNFKIRYPELSLRVGERFGSDRERQSTPEALTPYIDCLEETIRAYELWQHPERIWNCDETGLQMGRNGARTKFFARRGVRSVHVRATTDTRRVSLLFAFNAAGVRSPTTFIVPGARIPTAFWDGVDKLRDYECACVPEKKGYVTKKSFLSWLQLFVKFLNSRVRQGSVHDAHLLIYDQCSVHISTDIFKCALDNDIILFALPPHTTHITQPADVGMFSPLKKAYAEAEMREQRSRQETYLQQMKQWDGKPENRPQRRELAINDVPALLAPALQKSFSVANIIAAFRETGIHPFSRDMILAKAITSEVEKSDEPEENVLTGTTILEIAPVSGAPEDHIRFSNDGRTAWRQGKRKRDVPYAGMLTLQEHKEALNRQDMETEDVGSHKVRKNELAAERKRSKEEAKSHREKERLADHLIVRIPPRRSLRPAPPKSASPPLTHE